MNYTIERIPYHRLPISDEVLDAIGFTEYHDGNGYSGDRRLIIDGKVFEITEVCQTDDDLDGYGDCGAFRSTYWFYYKKGIQYHYDLFFIHEMYRCIQSEFPAEFLAEFESICRKNKMGVYIDSYLQTLKD